MSKQTYNPFLAQQIKKYTIGLQEYVDAAEINHVSMTNDFKQDTIITRSRLQPGSSSYQFDASPWSYYTSTYTPLSHTNNINSMTLDSLLPNIISTAKDDSDDNNSSLRVISAIPEDKNMFSMLKNAFCSDDDNGNDNNNGHHERSKKLSRHERKQKYLAQFGGMNGGNNTYYVDEEKGKIINIDETFEDEFISLNDNNNDDINDQDDYNNQINTMGDNNNGFDDVLTDLFGANSNSNNNNNNNNMTINQSSISNKMKNSTINTTTAFDIESILAPKTADGLIIDDFDAINNDLFNIDQTQMFDLFGSSTIPNMPNKGPNTVGTAVKRKAPSNLETINDIYDIDLETSINSSDFDIKNYLSNVQVKSDNSNAERNKQKAKEAAKEKELNDIYKDNGLLSPQEEAKIKRQRILGLTDPK